MTTIAHVICPVDLSACSQRALEYAYVWARWHHARVRVLHVIPPPRPVLGMGVRDDAVMLPQEPVEVTYAAVQQFVSNVPNPGVHVDVELHEGVPADVIHDLTSDDTHSVVVMGTRGRSGLARLILGSTAERVAHRTMRPLLVVPPREPSQQLPAHATFSRIVCGVDGRASSVAALRAALAFARQTDARLDILTVVETPREEETRTSRHYAVPEYATSRARELLSDLRALISDSARKSCCVREHAVVGSPADELLRLAGTVEADLLVVGRGDRPRIGSWFLGRTTDRLMRQATCPVLIMPATPLAIARAMPPLDRGEWTSTLDRVTKEFYGRPTTISIMNDLLGPEREVCALPLAGLTMDEHNGKRSLAIILGALGGTRVTHFVFRPTDLRLGELPDRHALELLITSRDGTSTIVQIGDAQ